MASQSRVIHASTFWQKVSERRLRGGEIVDRLEALLYRDFDENPYSEEEDLIERELVDLQKSLRDQFVLACEVVGAHRHAANFDKTWKPSSNLDMLPWVGVMVCPALENVLRAIDALQSVIPIGKSDFNVEGERERVRQILTGTATMLLKRKITPQKEAEVAGEVYQNLLYLFPDTVREMPIPKSAKTYKPDIGIRSLRLAIELKYIDSASELKSAIDGILVDTKAYADSEDWSHFIAVLYMTNQFMTPRQIESAFAQCEFPDNWSLVQAVGRGSRPTKPRTGANAESATKPNVRKSVK